MIDLVLCRSDAGDGGWSLHPGDTTDEMIAAGNARILASGDSEWDGARWNRPDIGDYGDAILALGPNSGGSIRVDVVYGARSVDDEDRDRARAAAARILNAAGIAAVDAFAEYQRQWAEHEDVERMTGAARSWHEAEVAADLALTAGWLNPDGASCTISA